MKLVNHEIIDNVDIVSYTVSYTCGKIQVTVYTCGYMVEPKSSETTYKIDFV